MSRKNAKVELSEEKVLSVLQKKVGFTVPEIIERLKVPKYRILEVRKVLTKLVQVGKAVDTLRATERGRSPKIYRSC